MVNNASVVDNVQPIVKWGLMSEPMPKKALSLLGPLVWGAVYVRASALEVFYASKIRRRLDSKCLLMVKYSTIQPKLALSLSEITFARFLCSSRQVTKL